MLSNQGILSNKWLLPLMVITIAAMALAFWAMMGNKASAGTPTKNAVAVGDIYLLPDTDADGAAAGWTTILDGAVDTANNHDVVAIMSMECGLHTRTKVKGKQGEEDSATASAGVMVRILINGMEMAPGEVRYCERTQELSARFGGVLEECTVDLVSGTFTSDDCTFSDEYIELMLHTINANSFNFIKLDLPSSGNTPHDIKVQAKVYYPNAGVGDSDAWGFIGKGALIVDDVKFAKAEALSLP